MQEFRIEDSFGFSLHHASYIFKARLRERFAAAGIDATPEEFVFLFLIPKGGAAQGVLTEKSLKEKTTVTRLIDRLVDKGWVARSENSNNRREQIIKVTARGWKIRDKILPLVREHVQAATKDIHPDHLALSRKVLNQIIDNLIW